MSRDIVRQLVNVIAVIATITVNALANILPINGLGTGEISDRFAIFFVPAGYVFSIWGLIYIGLIAFAIYQALPSKREDRHLRSIGYWFAAASAANIGWIFLWHYLAFDLTWVAMLVLLISLIMTYLRLGIGRGAVSAAEKWAAQIPISIYLGWITVATIANVTQVLFYHGWNGWGISPETWTAVMLAAAVIVGALMAVTRRDVAYLLVLVWAFVGIAVKHAGTPPVTISAWLATVVVAGLVAVALLPRSQRAVPVH